MSTDTKTETIWISKIGIMLTVVLALISIVVSVITAVKGEARVADNDIKEIIQQYEKTSSELTDAKYFPIQRGANLEARVARSEQDIQQVLITLKDNNVLLQEMSADQKMIMRQLNLKTMEKR